MSVTAHHPLPPVDVNQRYEVEEAARYLRIGRTNVFRLIRDGKLATIRHGRRTFVPGAEICRLSQAPAQAETQRVVDAIRQHMNSPDGQASLDAETARQLQCIADRLGLGACAS